MFEGLFQPVHLSMVVVLGFVMLTPFWLIFKKAGFSPWLSVLTMVPLVNLLVLYYVAFATWPQKTK